MGVPMAPYSVSSCTQRDVVTTIGLSSTANFVWFIRPEGVARAMADMQHRYNAALLINLVNDAVTMSLAPIKQVAKFAIF